MHQTHQTIKLSRGKHRSPSEGACVMELASMLAGESFSDHPNTVSPVIGSLLRTYNDSVGDAARQALYRYASRVVGSRSTARIEEARGDRLLAWTSGLQERRWSRLLLRWRLWPTGLPQQTDVVAAIGVHALLRRRDHDHSEVLALVDELLAMGCITPALPASPDRGEESEPRAPEAVGVELI